ncbi:MAG: hypothetical protein WC140_03445 [Bacteroidales bacterium]
MKNRLIKYLLIIGLVSIFLGVTGIKAYAQEKNKKPKTPVELAGIEADRLTDLLELDYYQTFYVDSILQTNIAGMMSDMKKLQKESVKEEKAYKQIEKKWTDKNKIAFKKLFTKKQYKKYIKDQKRIQKMRDAMESRKGHHVKQYQRYRPNYGIGYH